MNGKIIHFGRLFGIMVLKGSELSKGDKRRKFKHRVCFQGKHVLTQNWEVAIFQEVGSSLACMESGKAADFHSCLLGNEPEQADARRAYI